MFGVRIVSAVYLFVLIVWVAPCEAETEAVTDEITTIVSDVENTSESEGVGTNVMNEGASSLVEIVTDSNEFSYVVSILMDGKVACTGLLVDSRYVLTSFQCFNYSKHGPLSEVKNATVKVGSKNLDESGKDFNIKWMYDHPLLLAGNVDFFGFVVVELEDSVSDVPLRLADLANLIDTPAERTQTLMNSESGCTLVGYGTERAGSNEYSGVLHTLNMKLADWIGCQDIEVITKPEFEFCASAPSLHPDVCINEIGAPLICHGKVHGILISFNDSCTINSYNAVKFLRTDQARDFIGLIKACSEGRDCYFPRIA